MSDMDSMFKRYEHDVTFRTVVDSLMAIVMRLEMTPGELRECAVFACMLVEMRHPKPFRISAEDAARFVEMIHHGR
jgi:hypothetical protein